MFNTSREKSRLWLLILVGVVATLLGQTHAQQIFEQLPLTSGEIALPAPATTGDLYDADRYDASDCLLAANRVGTLSAPGSRASIGGINATELGGRLVPEQMAAIQKATGLEHAQIYLAGPRRNGGGGTYYLIRGDEMSVSIPIHKDVRLISHTHPHRDLSGDLVELWASPEDFGTLRMLQESGSPQRTSLIVPEVAAPFKFFRGRRP